MLLSILFVSGELFGQDTLKLKVDSLKSKIVELTDVLEKIKENLEEDKESKETAFIISLLDSNKLKLIIMMKIQYQMFQ